ncbi:hypothetical protein [Pedobacter aquatilis]|uniref:hypothetical protein n=1 Tax=Pedobacter aquatilis TaxID=351343 RepID=UPI00292F5727|nr:hypothetical protein [Pedobacter aquatilis]
MEHEQLYRLKLQLQSFGSLRPEAWLMLQQLLQFSSLKKGEHFNRTPGTLTWLATGVLKEYDAYARKKPSVINFLVKENAVVTRKLNAANFLVACTNSLLCSLDFDALVSLHQQFPELKPIYFALCAQYDEGQRFRVLLLEEKAAALRVAKLIDRYHGQLSFMARKDLSNYLQLNYDYFCRLYARTL